MLIHIQKPQMFPFAHTRPNINTLTYILSIYTSLCGTFLESFSIRSHEGRNCTQKKSPTSANIFSTLKSYTMTKYLETVDELKGLHKDSVSDILGLI